MFRLVLPLAFGLALTGCADTCANEIVSRLPSPDSNWDAVIFQRDCGATTGFSTQISVLPSGAQPIDSGNAFRADDDHGAARTGAWGGPWAEAKWLSSNKLLVRYAAKSRLFAQNQNVSDVAISYQIDVR